MSVEGI